MCSRGKRESKLKSPSSVGSGLPRSTIVMGVTRFFLIGTPVLALATSWRVTPWWSVLVPVIPVWYSMLLGIEKVRAEANVIRRPKRGMALDEAAAERRFLYTNAAFRQAGAERSEALGALAAARGNGEVGTKSPSWQRRRRSLLKTARRSRPEGR